MVKKTNKKKEIQRSVVGLKILGIACITAGTFAFAMEPTPEAFGIMQGIQLLGLTYIIAGAVVLQHYLRTYGW